MHYRRRELIQFIRETGSKTSQSGRFIKKTEPKTTQATKPCRPHDTRPQSQQKHTPSSGAAAPTSPARSQAMAPHGSRALQPLLHGMTDHRSRTLCQTSGAAAPTSCQTNPSGRVQPGRRPRYPCSTKSPPKPCRAANLPHRAVVASPSEAAASAYFHRPEPPPRLPARPTPRATSNRADDLATLVAPNRRPSHAESRTYPIESPLHRHPRPPLGVLPPSGAAAPASTAQSTTQNLHNYHEPTTPQRSRISRRCLQEGNGINVATARSDRAWVFTRNHITIVRINGCISTMRPSRRYVTLKNAAIIGTDRRRCKTFAGRTTIVQGALQPTTRPTCMMQ